MLQYCLKLTDGLTLYAFNDIIILNKNFFCKTQPFHYSACLNGEPPERQKI